MFNLILSVLLILPQVLCSPINHNYDDEWDGVDKAAKYWCNKLRTCEPGGPKVCGWDPDLTFLAEFENRCVLYRSNCRAAGHFDEVNMIVCETKKNYDKEHANETFEWEHVLHTNSPINQAATLKVTGKTHNRFKVQKESVKHNGARKGAYRAIEDDDVKPNVTTTHKPKAKRNTNNWRTKPRLEMTTKAHFLRLRDIEMEMVKDKILKLTRKVKVKPKRF